MAADATVQGPGGAALPNSEPWTQGELVRAVTNVMTTLHRIEEKLDERPDWEDINRLNAHRDKEQATQDVALKNLEDRMARAMTAAVGAILTALSTAGVLIVNLLNN